MSSVLLQLEQPAAWPTELRAYLDAHHELFLGWETGKVAPQAYDTAIYGLMNALQPYAITGWHCTRLTDAEIDEIVRNGMQLPDAAMLARRIDALVEAGQLARDIAQRLNAENQAGERNRAGMVWFCFFPPRVRGEVGIERFFRQWGGEVLYNSHERDPVTSSAICCIGTPSLVEADVPIASLARGGGLSFKIARRFLISRGYHSKEPVDHEDRIKRPLPANYIRRVVRFPGQDFIALTGCDTWNRPLGPSAKTKCHGGGG
jgi:hypothetical protein